LCTTKKKLESCGVYKRDAREQWGNQWTGEEAPNKKKKGSRLEIKLKVCPKGQKPCGRDEKRGVRRTDADGSGLRLFPA